MISTRDLHLILAKQIHTWLARSILALGDKDGPGGYEVDAMLRSAPRGRKPFLSADSGKIGHYVNAWKPRVPKFEPTHTPEIGLVPSVLKASTVVGNAEAQRLIKLVSARLKLRSAVKLNARIGRTGGYRHWLAGEISGTIADSGTGQALKEADSAQLKPWSALRKNNRARFGPQIISTSRRRETLPINKPFRFGGQSARRYPVGRPALSEAEWELRYRLRLMARRKTNRPGNRKGVRIPATRYGRPTSSV